MSEMLKEAKRLHALGFAVHWLYPKSKRPTQVGWQKSPPKTWEELESSYEKGMNLGVRTGYGPISYGPAQMEVGFLAALDCDLKSDTLSHKAELNRAMLNIMGSNTGWRVYSGRKNGSFHLYFVTRAPMKSVLLAKSKDKVGNKNAWEISLMSAGRQIVLPPSIHPETGKKYEWGFNEGYLPLIELSQISKIEPTKEGDETGVGVGAGPFQVEVVDLVGSGLSERIYNMIVDGEGVEDRSAALLSVSQAMLKKGFNENQILSVLTDPDLALGQTAYDHAQTRDRARAAAWVEKFTLRTAKENVSAEKDFEETVETIELGDEEAKKQAEELEGDWQSRFDRTENGKIKGTHKNVQLILKHACGDDPIFAYNEFATREEYAKDTPWGGEKGRELRDVDTIFIRDWLIKGYHFEPGKEKIEDAVIALAHKNRYHPVRNYLDQLEWDGIPRIDTWLKTYLQGEAPEPYLSAVSRKSLCALVARAYQPGIKFDFVLILEGKQGYGKSTALKIIGGEWFSDSPLSIGNKDAVHEMQSVWVYELGELAGMNKTDINLLKGFVSSRVDRARLSYMKRAQDYPRQCVFFGSTNASEYFRDPTGNRRFWPVKVGRCDFEALKRDRDQLFAEAKFAYELQENLYLNEIENEQANEIQEQRVFHDEWLDKLSAYFANPKALDKFKTSEMFTELNDTETPPAPLRGEKYDLLAARRISPLLVKLGWENKIIREGTQVGKWWVRGRRGYK